MSVFKIEKNRNYTTMSNYHLRDKNLSFKAKGLLSFMLSLPENWDYSMNGLVSVSKENIGAIRTILKELEDNKFLQRIKYQNEKGLFKYDYKIYEYPYDNLPYTENPHMDNPHADNSIQINTNIINTKELDKIDKQLNPLVYELINKNFINESDLNIYKYSDLFNLLLNQYEYKDIIIATNYILKKWKDNKGLDENKCIIENKYSYFKTSLENNLIKITNEVDFGW